MLRLEQPPGGAPQVAGVVLLAGVNYLRGGGLLTLAARRGPPALVS
jgi:hypothetical protein